MALPSGSHVLAAEFVANGPSTNPDILGTEGTLALFTDGLQIGREQIIAQPGYFCLTGDGICDGCLSSGVLLALILDLTLGWWWTDSCAAMVVAGFAVAEGVRHWLDSAPHPDSTDI